MKLKKGFVSRQVAGRWLLVAVGSNDFSGFVQGNETTGFIADVLQKDVTEDEIVEAVFQRYDADRETIRADVRRVLDELRRIGALDE
ncbi:MAG: PqqD family protein [Oscillospiraceae bacterium]|nr:PqqD family protein [Oscillospiraceae bacterium]